MTYRDAKGVWHRNRAITLAVQMRSGEQIFQFGEAVDKALATVRPQLPPDLIVARTSDQPKQVRELVSLLMTSLYEAIVLVVVVALVGFWDWRAAMLMAASIPLTLAMTFGIVHILNIDIQQVSIATLIIALGLLVDMPVVAGDAIKRELGSGFPRELASWVGPTKLAKAIVFATITNIECPDVRFVSDPAARMICAPYGTNLPFRFRTLLCRLNNLARSRGCCNRSRISRAAP